MLHTGLGTKTMYAFENGFFPSVSSHPPSSRTVQPLWAIINCYCQQHNQEREKKKKKNTPALIMSSAAGATHTQEHTKIHNTHKENGCYY